jgi:hypothetical protein
MQKLRKTDLTQLFDCVDQRQARREIVNDVCLKLRVRLLDDMAKLVSTPRTERPDALIKASSVELGAGYTEPLDQLRRFHSSMCNPSCVHAYEKRKCTFHLVHVPNHATIYPQKKHSSKTKHKDTSYSEAMLTGYALVNNPRTTTLTTEQNVNTMKLLQQSYV